MSREFRDELPSVLRSWHDWTDHGLRGFRYAVPVMAWLLVGAALGLLTALAATGHGLAALYRALAPVRQIGLRAVAR